MRAVCWPQSFGPIGQMKPDIFYELQRQMWTGEALHLAWPAKTYPTFIIFLLFALRIVEVFFDFY